MLAVVTAELGVIVTDAQAAHVKKVNILKPASDAQAPSRSFFFPLPI